MNYSGIIGEIINSTCVFGVLRWRNYGRYNSKDEGTRYR